MCPQHASTLASRCARAEGVAAINVRLEPWRFRSASGAPTRAVRLSGLATVSWDNFFSGAYLLHFGLLAASTASAPAPAARTLAPAAQSGSNETELVHVAMSKLVAQWPLPSSDGKCKTLMDQIQIYVEIYV
jgi:hypothetical protein